MINLKLNKKIFLIILIITVLVSILLILLTVFQHSNNKENSYNDIYTQEDTNSNVNLTNEFIIHNQKENVDNSSYTNTNSDGNVSPNIVGEKLNETGITLNGKPIKYNQKLSSKLNIAYMLGYNINHDIPVSDFETDMTNYINKNKPMHTGLWVATQPLLQGNPLDTDRFISILAQIGVNCTIDEFGFTQKINSSIEVCNYINEIIDSGKLVMIGFSPDYYAYIENYDNKANMTDTEYTYVSFEPYNNMYPYIITGKCDIEELTAMLKQITIDIKK